MAATPGGTIGISTNRSQSPKLVSWHEQPHTHFCLTMVVLLIVWSLIFPRSIGASGFTYKVREVLLIFAFASFLWTAFKRMKIWEFSMMGRLFAYVFSALILMGATTGMFFFHGIEERTDQQLQSRSYMKK